MCSVCLRHIAPTFTWRDQHPGIAESFESLGLVVEFPTKAALSQEGYSVKRNDIEYERKADLERNPNGAVRADESVDYGYSEL